MARLEKVALPAYNRTSVITRESMSTDSMVDRDWSKLPSMPVPGTALEPVLGDLVTSRAAAEHLESVSPDLIELWTLGDRSMTPKVQNTRIASFMADTGASKEAIKRHLNWTLVFKLARFVTQEKAYLPLEIPNDGIWKDVDGLFRADTSALLSDYAELVEHRPLVAPAAGRTELVEYGRILVAHSQTVLDDGKLIHSHYDVNRLQ